MSTRQAAADASDDGRPGHTERSGARATSGGGPARQSKEQGHACATMAAAVPNVLNTPTAIAEASVKPVVTGLVGLGGFVFDCDNGLLSRDGIEIPLPPRAVGILTCLIDRAGDVVPKQTLLDRVWKDTFVTEVSLVEAISLLRQTLHDDPQRPSFIQTIPRRGYRLVAPVRPLPRSPGDCPQTVAIGDCPQIGARGADSGTGLVLPTVETDRAAESATPEGDVWPGWLGWTFAALAGLALATVSVGLLRQPGTREHPVVRFAIDTNVYPSIDPGADVPRVAVSPNGQQVVFAGASDPAATPRLYLRDIDRLELTALHGTEGAAAPFFSPDGQWIGFFAGGALKKAPASSGGVVRVADAPRALGGTWLSDGSIVFGGGPSAGLSRVPASGGRTTVVTTPDLSAGEMRHAWPDALPGSRLVLFTALSPDDAPEFARISVLDLGTGRVEALIEAATFARFAPPGHVVFARGLALLAAPFDVESLTVGGPAETVLSRADRRCAERHRAVGGLSIGHARHSHARPGGDPGPDGSAFGAHEHTRSPDGAGQ